MSKGYKTKHMVSKNRNVNEKSESANPNVEIIGCRSGYANAAQVDNKSLVPNPELNCQQEHGHGEHVTNKSGHVCETGLADIFEKYTLNSPLNLTS